MRTDKDVLKIIENLSNKNINGIPRYYIDDVKRAMDTYLKQSLEELKKEIAKRLELKLTDEAIVENVNIFKLIDSKIKELK